MNKRNPLLDKSLLFAARIIKLNQSLTKEKKETVISKQIIRSATYIGARSGEINLAAIYSSYCSFIWGRSMRDSRCFFS